MSEVTQRDLTPRELRRYERKLARGYWHQAPRRSRCPRWYCVRCWRDQILGRHRRNLAAVRSRFAENEARTSRCEHDWKPRGVGGRRMPYCEKCGTVKWVRP